MSTNATASAVIPLDIEKVWANVRDFTFPGTMLQIDLVILGYLIKLELTEKLSLCIILVGKLISTIDACEMQDGANPHTVGGFRSMKWKTGESRVDRLLELSDQYRKITWEMIHAEPQAESSAAITTVRLFRITEVNHTLIQW